MSATTTPAKPGRKPNSRAELESLLKASEAGVEACARAKREKRPVEFVAVPAIRQLTSASEPVQNIRDETRVLWAWPDGTVTSPESLRQRLRNLKFRRAKHGEVMPA